MTDLEKNDKLKIKQLESFAAKYKKLLEKHPLVRVYGNREGEAVAHVTIGNNFSSRTKSINISQY
jgi:hypothetical protein